jgi:hypothetical protein
MKKILTHLASKAVLGFFYLAFILAVIFANWIFWHTIIHFIIKYW